MKSVSRNIAGLLILVLGVAVFGPVRQDASAAAKPVKISAMFDTTFLRKEDGQDQFLKEYKRLTGIELVVNQPAHNQYNEKLLISFASGDIPDVIEIDSNHSEIYMQLATEGAIIPLDKYIANSKVFKRINPIYINSLKYQGKIYGTPLNQGRGCLTYIRKDWLDNLGLKVPTTWNELYEVAKAFTFNDPDGNGKNDTVGFTLPGVGEYVYMADFYHGANHDFILKDGKWLDGFTEANFKPALARLRQAYQDKVIDQELFTNKTSTCREKFYAGKVGIFSYWSGNWGETLDHNVKLLDPNADVVAIPPIKETSYWNQIPKIIAVTSKAKNPEGVFTWINEYMHDGGTGQMLFTHGVEGVHWTQKDGKYQKLPSLNNPNLPAVKAYIHPELAIGPFADPIPLHPKIAASIKAHQSRIIQMSLMPSSNTYMRFGGEIMNLKEELIAKAIMGRYTVDQAIQEYKERSARLNVAQILKELNRAK